MFKPTYRHVEGLNYQPAIILICLGTVCRLAEHTQAEIQLTNIIASELSFAQLHGTDALLSFGIIFDQRDLNETLSLTYEFNKENLSCEMQMQTRNFAKLSKGPYS